MSAQTISRAVAVALGVGIALAGCSGATGSGDGAAGAGADAASIAEAEAVVAESTPNPTGIGYDTPITGTVPEAKKVTVLETPVPVAKIGNDYREASMDLIGWDLSRIVVGNGPEDPSNALAAALDSTPDAVVYAGYDPAGMEVQLDRAADEGIAVHTESVPGDYDTIASNVRDDASNDRIGRMTAAYVVADSGGDANVEFFGLNSQPIVSGYYDAFAKYLAEWCPDCSITFNNFGFDDIGTNIPGQVVSALQRNPEANYVIFGFGDASIGVVPALESAGLRDQVTIGGGTPSLENYEAMKNGEKTFWAVDTGPVNSWRETDLMVRSFLGEDISAIESAPLISQLLTTENVNEAVFDDGGLWIGYADYETDYRKLWNLG